jgi:3-oxoadipate enol-lactonase
VSLAFRIDGAETAPALVLSNSLGTTWELWDAQLPALSQHFRVVRYDHPGHGRSDVPGGALTVEALAQGVLELLDRLELERASFCGLSLGGAVGMELALEAPGRIDRLALCCTAASFGSPVGWHERAQLVRAEGTTAIADRVLERWFTDRFPSEHQDEVTRFRTMLTSISSEGYAACCEAIAGWDARGGVHAIRTPTLVISGEDDVAAPPADGAFLAESIHGAELVVLPGAAHLANVEEPNLFDQALLGFLSAPTTTSEEAA